MAAALKEIVKITKTLRLLYVEDDEQARVSTLEMLKIFFDDIVVAVDGLDGLEKFKTSDCDLIITDINMPRMSGIEMLKEISSDIPSLILSAHNDSDYFIQTIQLGVDGYVFKPLDSKQFIQVLEKIIDKISLKRYKDEHQHRLEEEVKERTKALQDKLYYDDLTGLLSRYSFFKDIKNTEYPNVLIIDINKFNIINEIYSESVGNLVLKSFGEFLLEYTQGSTYKVYRLSGDEFIIWDYAERSDIEKCEQEILALFEALKKLEIKIEEDVITIDVTMGYSITQKDAFESARIALEYAKKNQLNFKNYCEQIDEREEHSKALVWKRKIQSAIDDKRIIPVYQPIVDKDEKIIKYETLMRLQEIGTNNLISPFFFLDIAKKTRQYNELSTKIIFEALETLINTQQRLSLNFAYGDMENPSLLNGIEKLLKKHPTLGKKVVFEITESESIGNYSEMKDFIQRFRAYGIQIAIDDFGSGFSNFEYILEIEPDYLKIDGSLIKHIDTDCKSYTLVEAIVQFSHKLEIKVIAEFVHSEVIFKMLKKLDVDEYQGFYFSEPLEYFNEE